MSPILQEAQEDIWWNMPKDVDSVVKGPKIKSSFENISDVNRIRPLQQDDDRKSTTGNFAAAQVLQC